MDKTDTKCLLSGFSISIAVIILRRLLDIEIFTQEYFALWAFVIFFVGGILSYSQVLNDK